MEDGHIDVKNEGGKKPGLISSLLACKCPRCRRGDMFEHKNPYTKKFMLILYIMTGIGKQTHRKRLKESTMHIRITGKRPLTL